MDNKQVERVARRLCVIRGFNPDDMVPHSPDPDSSGVVYSILLYSPRWERVAREVRARMEMDAALEEPATTDGEE
jgi:hypothetical protein